MIEAITMTPLSLEHRVAALEKQVAQMKAQGSIGRHEKAWLRTMGMFGGDEGLKSF